MFSESISLGLNMFIVNSMTIWNKQCFSDTVYTVQHEHFKSISDFNFQKTWRKMEKPSWMKLQLFFLKKKRTRYHFYKPSSTFSSFTTVFSQFKSEKGLEFLNSKMLHSVLGDTLQNARRFTEQYKATLVNKHIYAYNRKIKHRIFYMHNSNWPVTKNFRKLTFDVWWFVPLYEASIIFFGWVSLYCVKEIMPEKYWKIDTESSRCVEHTIIWT